MLVVVGFPILAKLMLVGGGNDLALSQKLAAVLADLVAGVALFELFRLLGIYDGLLVIGDILLFAAVTFMPVLDIVVFPIFAEVVFVRGCLLHRNTICEEVLGAFLTGFHHHKIEGDLVSIFQSQNVAVVRYRRTTVCVNLLEKGFLLAVDIGIVSQMINNGLNGVGIIQIIPAISVGYEQVIEALGKQDLELLGDIAAIYIAVSGTCGHWRKSVAGVGGCQFLIQTKTPVSV